MRILGVDFGVRRIGLAVSDATGTLASPLRTLQCAGGEGDGVRLVVEAIGELASDEPVEGIVVGLPRALDGTETDVTRQVRAFATRLEAAVACPVAFQDERLSTHEAESRLAVRRRDWRARKARLDAAAAAIVLQDWLDERSARRPSVDTPRGR